MQQPDGIIITISAGMLKEKGLFNWTRNFLIAMRCHEDLIYYMRVGAKPKRDASLSYVYLCIGGKIRYRAFYAGSAPASTMTFGDKTISARAWVMLSGPVEKPTAEIPMKGFRGYRYTEKLF